MRDAKEFHKHICTDASLSRKERRSPETSPRGPSPVGPISGKPSGGGDVRGDPGSPPSPAGLIAAGRFLFRLSPRPLPQLLTWGGHRECRAPPRLRGASTFSRTERGGAGRGSGFRLSAGDRGEGSHVSSSAQTRHIRAPRVGARVLHTQGAPPPASCAGGASRPGTPRALPPALPRPLPRPAYKRGVAGTGQVQRGGGCDPGFPCAFCTRVNLHQGPRVSSPHISCSPASARPLAARPEGCSVRRPPERPWCCAPPPPGS